MIFVAVFSVYYISYFAGSQRAAVAAVGVFLVVGLLLLQRVKPVLRPS